jgi:hypothetical protein
MFSFLNKQLTTAVECVTTSSLHKICNTTPNPTCGHSLESSQHKEKSPKISVPKDSCSMSYNKSKIWLENPKTLLHTLPNETSFSPSFLSSGPKANQPMLPYLKAHQRSYFFPFLHFSSHLFL